MIQKDMTEKGIIALFEQWNVALQSGDAKQVSALYDSSAILLPTISNKVRLNDEEIIDYFDLFLAQDPIGEIEQSYVRIFDNVAIHSGIYHFTFKDGSSVQARFTFIYRDTGQGWKIIEHHSSAMPEQVNLFDSQG